MGGELVLARRPRRRDRRQDPAAGREDLHVARAPLPQLELVLAAAGEEQVGVGIDEARRHGAAARVEPGEPPERIALGLEQSLEVGARPDADDPILPGGDDRRRRHVRPPSSAVSRATSACIEPARRPPAIVTTSEAPTTRNPGADASPRPPGMTRRLTPPPPRSLRRAGPCGVQP